MSASDGLRVVKFFLEEGAILPSRESQFAAGYDLYTPTEFSVEPGQKVLVKTGVHYSGMANHMLELRDRSSMAYKRDLEVSGGIIDEDYRGGIGVILRNHGKETQSFSAGERIAQAIFTPVSHPDAIEQVYHIDDLGTTKRGEGGFGSTGK